MQGIFGATAAKAAAIRTPTPLKKIPGLEHCIQGNRGRESRLPLARGTFQVVTGDFLKIHDLRHPLQRMIPFPGRVFELGESH
jgi:hypothetical protein